MDGDDSSMRSIRRDMKIIKVIIFIVTQLSIVMFFLTLNLTIRD